MVAKKTAAQQKAALMALMESNQRDLVLDAPREDRPTIRHRHRKNADVATKPASFRLPIDVLRQLDEYVWSDANRAQSGKPRMSRADVVATALREWLRGNMC